MSEIDEDERVRASYDRVPYPSVCHPEAQPDVLATLAFLYGMSPPPLASCRVLELGCASGANLIPAALRMPGARFLGIDLAPRQIEAGQRRIAALGLTNVELRTAHLRDVGAELGTFDYVIAHGLFSWVSAPVQDEVLRVCGERLAPDGVAYVSYNTLPGWHADLKLREMLQYHNRGRTDPREITDRSLDLLGFLAEAASGRDDEHAHALRAARSTKSWT
jgi:SAM-dependent methyltransferase